VHYHSKHQPHRREIWRYQWDKRFELDDNQKDLHQNNRERVQREREDRRYQHREDIDDKLARDKLVFSTLPEQKREDKHEAKKMYRKELEQTMADTAKEREHADVNFRLKWTQDMAKVRKDRREARQEERGRVLGKDDKKDGSEDSYYLVHRNEDYY